MLCSLRLDSEGMVDPGEDAAAAAVREVKEETGIDAEVVALIAFREAHMPKNSTWMSGNTNIFMTFLLKPKTQAIAVQEREIAKCEWCVSCRMHGCGKHPAAHVFAGSAVGTFCTTPPTCAMIDAIFRICHTRSASLFLVGL